MFVVQIEAYVYTVYTYNTSMESEDDELIRGLNARSMHYSDDELANDDRDDDNDNNIDDDSSSDNNNSNNNDTLIVNSVYNLIKLIDSGSDSGSQQPLDYNGYKVKTKQLLEQLLVKLEEDVDYQHHLEVQIETLENSVATKDASMKRLSQQAIEAIEDCKLQAEEMATEMMTKIASEVGRRKKVEKVVMTLQRENVRLKGQMVRTNSSIELERLKLQRKAELLSLCNMGEKILSSVMDTVV